MKTFLAFLIISIFLVTTQLAIGQEPKIISSTSPNSNTKGQDHNSSRSNKSASTTAPEPDWQAEGQNNKDTKSENSNAANAKKGYEYYKAKSDLNLAKVRDHNSSRSNKTSLSNMNADSTGAEKKVFNQNSSRSNNTK